MSEWAAATQHSEDTHARAHKRQLNREQGVGGNGAPSVWLPDSQTAHSAAPVEFPLNRPKAQGVQATAAVGT